MTIPEYTVAAAVAAGAVVVADRFHWHSGLVRQPAYRLTMAICLFFMVLSNGWLTKLSAPIVLYAPSQHRLGRFPLDIPIEDFLYGFALLHWVLCRWVVLGRTEATQDLGEASGRASLSADDGAARA